MKWTLATFLVFFQSIAFSDAKVVGNGAATCEGPKFSLTCEIVALEKGQEAFRTSVTFSNTKQKIYLGDSGRYEAHFCPAVTDDKKSVIYIHVYNHLSQSAETIYLVSALTIPIDQSHLSMELGAQDKEYRNDVIKLDCARTPASIRR